MATLVKPGVEIWVWDFCMSYTTQTYEELVLDANYDYAMELLDDKTHAAASLNTMHENTSY